MSHQRKLVVMVSSSLYEPPA